MSPEVLKTTLSVAGGAAGAVAGAYFKSWFDLRQQKRRLREEQEQTRWLPLLEATKALKRRFEELSLVFGRKQHQLPFSPESLAGDFAELYILKRERVDLNTSDGNRPRRDAELVQTVRTRMAHHLNYAASSLYIMATYLAHAGRAFRAVREHSLVLSTDKRGAMEQLLSQARSALQGNGSGIPWEEQESVAEMVLNQDGSVITYFEFRRRLLDMPGWEQFMGLFRFFVEFEPKVNYEVANTIGALGELESGLQRMLDLAPVQVAQVEAMRAKTASAA